MSLNIPFYFSTTLSYKKTFLAHRSYKNRYWGGFVSWIIFADLCVRSTRSPEIKTVLLLKVSDSL